MLNEKFPYNFLSISCLFLVFRRRRERGNAEEILRKCGGNFLNTNNTKTTMKKMKNIIMRNMLNEKFPFNFLSISCLFLVFRRWRERGNAKEILRKCGGNF